nr:reverse transcriptase domain-containing protein [Tanacetum cinerariifolium]
GGADMGAKKPDPTRIDPTPIDTNPTNPNSNRVGLGRTSGLRFVPVRRPEHSPDRLPEISPTIFRWPFREQIEGHLSALRSLLKEHNGRGNVSPIRLSFDDVEDQTRVRMVVTGKEIGDADLKRPFKEAVKTPLTRRIIEFAGLKFKMPITSNCMMGPPIRRIISVGSHPQRTQEKWPMPANETLVAFKERWILETGFITGVPEVMKISSFMDAQKCPELAKRYSDKVPKTVEEMMIRLDDFVRPKETFASTELPKGEASEASRKSVGPVNKWEDRDGLVPYRTQTPYQAPRDQGFHHPRFNLGSLTKLPKEILASEPQLNLQPPRPMQLPPKKENQDKYCDYHGEKGHYTNDCFQLRRQLEMALESGKLNHLWPNDRKRNSVERDKSWMKAPIVFPPLSAKAASDKPLIIEADTHMDLVGFAGGMVKPLGKNELEVVFGNRDLFRTVMINFTVVRAPSPYIVIFGRTGLRSLRAVSSTIHSMDDKEKTAFYTNQGTYCYTKMSFGLKNAWATYQRLVDTAFQTQIGKNLEAYVDDMVIKSNDEKVLIEDIAETFDNLHRINMKLNPKKCSFGVEEGKILGYMVTFKGIRANPKKTKAIIDMQSPRTLKEMQSLSGKLDALKRFVSRSAKRSLPFFETLKDITKENKDEYSLTKSVEKAFQEMKKVIVELSLLTTPVKEETIYVYVAAATEAISAVLLTERKGKQCPIHYVSQTLNEAKRNYAPLEKLVLLLLHMSRRLRRYFKAHPIKVITDQPLKHILNKVQASGKLAKYPVELGAYNITYEPRNTMKGQVLTAFLSGAPVGTHTEEFFRLPAKFPSSAEYTYAFQLNFTSTNNEAKYEALLLGLRIARNMKADILSKLATHAFDHLTKKVLVEVLAERSTNQKEIGAIIEEEEEDNWMKPIIRCLAEGVWPKDKDERRALRMKINQLILEEGVLFKKGYLLPMLRCVGPLQANYVIREIHMGSCEMHIGASLTYESAAVIPTKIGIPTHRTMMIREDENEDELHLNMYILQERREATVIREAKYKTKIEEYYNQKVKLMSFKSDEYVFRRNEASRVEDQGKLGLKWEGPYRVTEAYQNGSYKLQTLKGKEVPQTWHIINLRKCYV